MAKVLGKGLAALIRNSNSDYDNNYIPIKNIIPNPNQPRKNFNEKGMDSLIQSIRQKGIIQPLAVRKINNDKFELISGERRLRAAKSIGLKIVPAHFIDINNNSESMELALIENIQRIDLNPIEEAEAYYLLITKHKKTQENIAQKISKSRSEIANKIRLLKLPKVVQLSMKNKEIDYGHARALLGIKQKHELLKMHQIIIAKKLNVRQTELLIKSANNKNKIKKISLKNYHKQIAWLRKYLNTNVQISNGKKNKIIIEFANDKEFNTIIDKIINE